MNYRFFRLEVVPKISQLFYQIVTAAIRKCQISHAAPSLQLPFTFGFFFFFSKMNLIHIDQFYKLGVLFLLCEKDRSSYEFKNNWKGNFTELF